MAQGCARRWGAKLRTGNLVSLQEARRNMQIYRTCRNHVCACQIMCALIMLLAHSLPWYSRAKTSRPPWPKLQLRPVRNFEEACLPNAQAGS